MSEQLSFDAVQPTKASKPRSAPQGRKWPANPARRALAAYAAGDLAVTAAAIDAAAEDRTAEIRNLMRGSGDFSVLDEFLTLLHAEVPRWIDKTVTLTADGRAEAAERCADVVACGGAGMFTEDRRQVREDDEPQPSMVRAALAEALGILAHRDGGVTFSGQHWCVRPHNDCPGTWDVRYPDLHQVEISQAGRSSTGAYFTPRHLAEDVSSKTLEALVYEPGPLQAKCCPAGPSAGHTCGNPNWKLKASASILALRTADIAVGAGSFLLAGARYLADRVLDAWESENDPRAGDRPEALRLVIDACLYGVDINPWSVELARLALALLAPHTVMPNLTRHLRSGDSLLGVHSLDQIRWMDIRAERGQVLHAVPHPYTRITGEFADAIQAVMGDPRPDLHHPDLWDLFEIICNLVVHAAYVTSKNPDSAASQVIRLTAAHDAHELLTANTSWRSAR